MFRIGCCLTSRTQTNSKDEQNSALRKKLRRRGESDMRVCGMCANAAADTLFVAFHCRRKKRQRPPVCGVRAIALSSDVSTQKEYICSGRAPHIWGVGYVRSTGSLLVYLDEVSESGEFSRWLITVEPMPAEKSELIARHRLPLPEDWHSIPAHFSELTMGQVICGGNGFFHIESQVIHVFEVSAAHQIESLQGISTPKFYSGFDARDASGRSLVALAHCSEQEVCVYELLADALELRYRISSSELQIADWHPTHVLCFGDCLLAACEQTFDQFSAYSLGSAGALLSSAVLRTNRRANRISTTFVSWLWCAVGDRLAVYSVDTVRSKGKQIWFISLNNVHMFPLFDSNI